MKYIKYFFEFLFSIFFFLFFKIIGPKLSSKISGKIFEIIGPFFRSKKVIYNNIKRALPEIDENNLKNIENLMWNNYGRIFAEYIFLKDFRYGRLASNVQIEGQLIKLKKKNYSTALMIDQRVSEGILSPLFNEKALTTTIPAQLVKKFNIPIVPVYIERIDGLKFKITINQPLSFPQDTSQQQITDNLNQILEKFILSKPENWIWSHNRWK